MTTHALTLVGREGDRSYFVLGLDNIDDWPDRISLASRYFVLLIVADDPEMRGNYEAVMGKAIEQGAIYFVTWGPGCPHIETEADMAIIKRVDETDATLIPTASHDGESLDDALFFFMACAWPSSAYEATCTSWLAVTIGASHHLPAIIRYLRERCDGPPSLSS